MDILTEYNLISQYLTWAKKKEHNFRYAEVVADYHDDLYTGELTDKKKEKYLINYDLYNGRADMASMAGGPSYMLDGEEISASYENISHHDIMSQVAKAMVGEQRKRLLYPTVVDSSMHTVNMRKERKMQLLQDYFEQTVYEPIRQQITEKYFVENGIEDPYSLTIEQQQQANADIETKMKVMSPAHIEEYMSKEYNTPYEIQGQRLLNYLMEDLNIKFTTDEGFKHGLITGIEVYRLGINNNSPIFELCNPMGFNYGISSDKTFIQDADWITYEEYSTLSEIFNKYGNKLKKSDLKKLEGAVQFGSNRLEQIESNIVWEFAKNPESYASENIDIRTKEGQSHLRRIHSEINSDNSDSTGYKIRVLHVVWKTLRLLKYVRRSVEGKERYYYRDESYVLDPSKGDISVTDIYVPEIWQCVKIGEGDGTVYTEKGPVPYQNLSIDDPYNIKMPYYGAEYSRLLGNSENVSVIDLGKPWQYKFNVQMAKIEESEATDLGRVVSMYLTHKPDNYTFEEWFNMMRYSKVLLMNNTKEESSSDPQAIRELNLGNQADIQAKIGYLEFLRNQVVYSMMYNPQSLGQIGQYATAYNVQQSQSATSNQTEDIFAYHNQIVQASLNGLINYARIAYKDNPLSVTYVLSDLDKADLELDTEMLWRSKIGIFIKNTGEDIRNLMEIKTRAQDMIQNGLITFPDLIKLQLSRSTAEVYQIAQSAENRRKEQEAANREEQMIAQREALAAQKAASDQVLAWEQQKHADEMAEKRYYSEMESEKLRNMNDVDANNKSDAQETADRQMLMDAVENDKKRKLEEKIHKDKMEIEKLKLKKQ